MRMRKKELIRKTDKDRDNDKGKPDRKKRLAVLYGFIFTLFFAFLAVLQLRFEWERYSSIQAEVNIQGHSFVLGHLLPILALFLFVTLLFYTLLYIWLQRSRLKDLNKELILKETLYRSVFEQAPIGIAVMEDNYHIGKTNCGYSNINPKYEKILGRKKDELDNISWTEISHPEDLAEDLEKFEQLKSGEIDGYSMEKRFLRTDGSYVWTKMQVSPFLDFHDKHYPHLCLLSDISKRKETELALREKERSERVIMLHLPGLAYRSKSDKDGTFLTVSSGCYELTGYPPEYFIENKIVPFNEIIVPEHRELLMEEWGRTLPNKLPYRCEYQIITASGERKWVYETGQGIYDSQGEIEAMEGIILDISDNKEMEYKLRYIYEHDKLTGLYNREYLELLLEKDSGNKELKRALISINLNNVGLLTPSYGFHYTQSLIIIAAEALKAYSSEKHLLCKTHDSRFAFYITDYEDKDELISLAKEIADTLAEIFVPEGIGGGIGILEIDEAQGLSVDMLLKRLLITSEKSINIQAKDFLVSLYDKNFEARINRDSDIREALSRVVASEDAQELFLQYQPIFDLKTGAIRGLEALARLKTEKLGLVSPGEFIPIAEKSKLIIPIGEKIFFKALRFMNKMKERGHDNVRVSINVSAIQLLRPGFGDRLFEIINETGVNPENIGIEITESVFTSDFESINSTLARLRNAGLHIFLDDFGTGYSSLSREIELMVDGLKIDKSFVDKLVVRGQDKGLTADIISIARRRGQSTIAEGVEHESQLQYLRDHGCDMVQGFLLSKPLDEEATVELLEKHS